MENIDLGPLADIKLFICSHIQRPLIDYLLLNTISRSSFVFHKAKTRDISKFRFNK